MRRTVHCLLFLTSLLLACEPESGPPSDETLQASTAARPPAIEVQTAPAKEGSIQLTRTLSAKLEAARQVPIAAQASGTIQELPAQEGTTVAKSGLIARLDDTALQLQLDEAHLAQDRALVEKQDLLIANGGDAEVDTSVSPKRLDLILTLSGYREAQQRIKQINYELQKTKIRAGLIADLDVQRYQQISSGTELCRLIDPGSFEAVFQLLEKEALQLQKGQRVEVIPQAGNKRIRTARVSSINPLVSKEGLVRVHARLRGNNRDLFEGMNLQVRIQQAIPDQIIVPAEAIVLRSGRPVVFVHDPESGRAKWNYVTIAHRNETQVALSEGIKPGDAVIVEGNLTLSHDAEVQEMKSQ